MRVPLIAQKKGENKRIRRVEMDDFRQTFQLQRKVCIFLTVRNFLKTIYDIISLVST